MLRTFIFEFKDSRNDFYFTIGNHSPSTAGDTDVSKPDWTKLQWRQCLHCLLESERECCPAALDMAHLVEHFRESKSSESVTLHALTHPQKHSIVTDLQNALAFVFTAAVAESYCPYAGLLRPADFFGKPFPDADDFLFFGVSSDLVRRHFGISGPWLWSESEASRSDAPEHPAAVDLVLAFSGLRNRVEKATRGDAAAAALGEIVRRFQGLIDFPERAYGRLRQCLGLS